MPARQPTADQFRAFRDDPHEGPICQVNLLKFRERATYDEADPEHGDGSSGRDAYQRYADAFGVAAAEVGGTCLLMAEAERFFIGDGDWDAVMVMQFPNRKAFIATLNHRDYNEMHRHREAGLAHQDLVVTRPSVVAGDAL